MVVPNGYDYSCHAAGSGVDRVLFRELAVPRIPLMWRTHVRGDGTAIQGGVSGESPLYRYRHQRTGGDSLALSVRNVVVACYDFSGCRDYHAQIPEVVVLGGNGGIREHVYRIAD